ncbi:hypothetical protein [Nocardia aurantia]|uniref:Uncharacterized protein n=1 Tax=Nocardia aurantia TaxID=2585199 RepID=A0A7K0DU81_9NOCA|nr:hypothetical protein [Nocardia aurantia]MQY29319.1 hypothetical protein [Nocardia aurantia]
MARKSSALRRCCLAAGVVGALLGPIAGPHAVATLTACGDCVVSLPVGPGIPGIPGGPGGGGNPDEDRGNRSGNDTFPRGLHIFPGVTPDPLNLRPPSNSIPGGMTQQPPIANLPSYNEPVYDEFDSE